jgi:long-chain acyl-CoA synthetase
LARLEQVLEAPGPYRPEQHLELDLELDSLDLVQVRLLLADEFGVELADEEVWRLQTIGDALSAVVATPPPASVSKEDYSWPAQLRAPPQTSLDERFTMDRSGLKRWCASLGMLLIALFAKLWFRLEVRGKEHLPEGPFLLCPNHQSLLDSPLVYGAFPLALVHRLVFVAYGPYFHEGPLAILVRMGRLILTGEAGNVGDSMRCAFDALQRGWSVVIFPEGNCSFDGSLLPAFPGVGLLACEAQVPIVPVLYEGSGAVCSPRHPGFGRAKITITIGAPFSPPPREEAKRAEWQGVAERWREEILSLRASNNTSA